LKDENEKMESQSHKSIIAGKIGVELTTIFGAVWPAGETRKCARFVVNSTFGKMGYGQRKRENFLRSVQISIRRALKAFVLGTLEKLGWRFHRRIAGRNLYFDPKTVIGWELFVTAQFESDAITQCARFIQPDGIVVDIGANIGVHTVQFAVLASAGTVVSFEPSRATYQYLLRNIVGLTNVVPLNLALSDTTALMTFYVASDDAFSGLKDTNRKAILRQETVPCYCGDEILWKMFQNQRVDLVKIDVEGLETQVLIGMRKFLEEHRPVIFCEIFGGRQSNADPEETVRLCVSLGYDAFVLNAGQLIPAGAHSDEFYNYFFIPRS
jgi:FkbM family methyltransferase